MGTRNHCWIIIIKLKWKLFRFLIKSSWFNEYIPRNKNQAPKDNTDRNRKKNNINRQEPPDKDASDEHMSTKNKRDQFDKQNLQKNNLTNIYHQNNYETLNGYEVVSFEQFNECIEIIYNKIRKRRGKYIKLQ